MSRLTARFWVDAYLAHLRRELIPCFVLRHGDDTAGAVLVKVNTLDGHAKVFHRSFDLNSGAQIWAELFAGSDAEIDAFIARQGQIDPDLWVLEVEDRAGRHCLHNAGLS